MGEPASSYQNETVELSGVRVRLRRDLYSPTIVDALARGSYESGERGVLSRLLAAGDRVIEVGGAIGCVAMVAAKIVGAVNVRSYEANPELVEDAKVNFVANNLPIDMRNAVLKNRICWAGPGARTDFHVNADYWASSLVAIPGTIKTIAIPTVCFEQQAREFGANTLICDIEGGEVELLELADLTGFDKILVEIHYWSGRQAINRMIRKLIFDGFSINFDISFGSIVSLHRGLSPPQCG
jgi:FkbM family methyltransferase